MPEKLGVKRSLKNKTKQQKNFQNDFSNKVLNRTAGVCFRLFFRLRDVLSSDGVQRHAVTSLGCKPSPLRPNLCRRRSSDDLQISIRR